MNKNNRYSTYRKAKHRVDRLRGFYTHAAVYILINLGISTFKIIRNLTHGESFSEALFDLSTFIPWGLWGIGLGLHAFYVFGLPKLLGHNWEEDKIKEFMNDEESNRF